MKKHKLEEIDDDITISRDRWDSLRNGLSQEGEFLRLSKTGEDIVRNLNEDLCYIMTRDDNHVHKSNVRVMTNDSALVNLAQQLSVCRGELMSERDKTDALTSRISKFVSRGRMAVLWDKRWWNDYLKNVEL
tara:strand:- start:719 stop:1114 length:396 start_codon:yes stop_codon:yes gene_type:complete